jgi:hypothetical protein
MSKGHGWTPERRAKQAAAIHRWKPWKQNPGVKTDAGKAASKMNALKHGARSAAVRELTALLGDVNDVLDGDAP